MSEEILINVTPAETRVALIENGVLQDVQIERSASRGIVGNIFKGKVVRVLPGMQAAFVDIGLARASFLHIDDIDRNRYRPNSEHESLAGSIRNLLHDGQPVVVQVMKDPLGTKGARLTTYLSLSSRYLVYMPGSAHIGVSQRIDDDALRLRLKTLVDVARRANGQGDNDGYIVRTAAESSSENEIQADIAFLASQWRVLEGRIGDPELQGMVYQDLPLSMRTLRDQVRGSIERIRVDSRETHAALLAFAADFVPEVVGKIDFYSGERPLFDLYSVEDEIQKALSRKVNLKSGGYLIIDQTEAMTVIDVNTGGFVGHRNLEETIFKTNLEAATGLARQLRVRNLGGMIIVDFIDMQDAEHRRQVVRTLEKALEKDLAKTSISGVSDLGLVQMTRKRTRESLENIMCEPCPACIGRGSLKSPQTVCYEIFREVIRVVRAYDNRKFMVLASPMVVDRLLDEESANVADLEEFVGGTIQFQVENIYSQEQFDVIVL